MVNSYSTPVAILVVNQLHSTVEFRIIQLNFNRSVKDNSIKIQPFASGQFN
jgi:hypothetical protein